jgi:hypothetical protein|eukprot:COSAG06_NODE_3226_length_5655_cov_3.893629_5_plen_301_part_00
MDRTQGLSCYRQLRQILQMQLDSNEPLELPDPATSQDFSVVPKEMAEVIARAPGPAEQQAALRCWYEHKIGALDEDIAKMQRQIGEDRGGEEVFVCDDPPAAEELPDAVGQAAADGDIAVVLTYLGPASPAPPARINARWKNKMQRTLLHEASYEVRLELMALLVERGADMNIQSLFGQTPLMQACGVGRLDASARFLLKAGARSDVLGQSGTPLAEIAEEEGNHKLAALLRTELGGRQCEIFGLTGRPDLNGCCGVAGVFSQEKGRYAVQVDGTNERVRVKPSNLRRVAPAAAGEGVAG